MSIDYRFDSELKAIIVTAIGYVTVDDRGEFVRTILHDPSMPQRAPILIDACRITNALDVQDADRMVLLIQQLAARFQDRIAYYVTSVGLVTPYSLVAFTANLQRADIQAFTNRNEALAWLISSEI